MSSSLNMPGANLVQADLRSGAAGGGLAPIALSGSCPFWAAPPPPPWMTAHPLASLVDPLAGLAEVAGARLDRSRDGGP